MTRFTKAGGRLYPTSQLRSSVIHAHTLSAYQGSRSIHPRDLVEKARGREMEEEKKVWRNGEKGRKK